MDRPGARSRASSHRPRLVPPPDRPLRAMPGPEAKTALPDWLAAGARHGLRAQFAPAPHGGHTRTRAPHKPVIPAHRPPHAIPPAAAAAARRFRPPLPLQLGNSAISALRCRMAIPAAQCPQIAASKRQTCHMARQWIDKGQTTINTTHFRPLTFSLPHASTKWGLRATDRRCRTNIISRAL